MVETEEGVRIELDRLSGFTPSASIGRLGGYHQILPSTSFLMSL